MKQGPEGPEPWTTGLCGEGMGSHDLCAGTFSFGSCDCPCHEGEKGRAGTP